MAESTLLFATFSSKEKVEVMKADEDRFDLLCYKKPITDMTIIMLDLSCELV